MKYLLNEREKGAVRVASQMYYERFSAPAKSDPDLIVHLGDNPQKWLCWSAVSGRVPTFRTGGGFLYNPHLQSWMLPKDKLSALGFPVIDSVANAMGVKPVPVADHFRAASIAGNSFHFSTVAIVQLVALACYRLKCE